VIDGVCGGVAEYFDIDPLLVRVGCVLLIFAGGLGLLLYLVAMIIMPSAPFVPGQVNPPTQKPGSENLRLAVGIVLIVIGFLFLGRNLDLFTWRWISWMFTGIFLPALLILAGVALLALRRRNESKAEIPSAEQQGGQPAPEQQTEQPVSGEKPPRRLYRSRLNRKIFGVCGGLADYFETDVTIVRLLFIVSAFLSAGITILAYLILAVVIPEEPLFTRAA
jgi:phage shock protein C